MFRDYRTVRAIQAERYAIGGRVPRIQPDRGVNAWERLLRDFASGISARQVSNPPKVREAGST